MLKSSRHSPRPLEVIVMFEPYRLQRLCCKNEGLPTSR